MTPSLSSAVVRDIRQRILSGELVPGERLPPEPEMTSTYGVSRTTVREAVSRLRAEGLVETRHGAGSFVIPLPEAVPFRLGTDRVRSHADLIEMIEFRIGVEPAAAAMAAARISPHGARAVREAAVAVTTGGPDTAVEADFAFHRAIAVASGNRFFVDLVDSLGPMMIMLSRTGLDERHSLEDPEYFEQVRREHDDIAAAVIAGEEQNARAAMQLHLGTTRRRLVGG